MKFALASILAFASLFSTFTSAQLADADYLAQLDFARGIVRSSSVGIEARATTIQAIVRVVRTSQYANLTSADELRLAYLKDDNFRYQVDAQIPAGVHGIDHDAIDLGLADMMTCDYADVMMGLGLDMEKCRRLGQP